VVFREKSQGVVSSRRPRRVEDELPVLIRFSEHPIAGGRLFLKAFYWDLWRDLAHVRLEYQRATGAALLIGKWWKFARFPFHLVTKPPALKKYYYQTWTIKYGLLVFIN
jgi:hypothetical protein